MPFDLATVLFSPHEGHEQGGVDRDSNERATGLEPNMPHPQHIHGLLDANAPNTALATAGDDTDHDGYIELAEGQMSYGPILLDLSSPPGGALADFPTAPGGVIISHRPTI